MSKYINADELAEEYLKEENCYPIDDYFEGYADGIIFSHHLLDEMPSADVVEKSKLKELLIEYLDGLYPAEEFMEILEEETE